MARHKHSGEQGKTRKKGKGHQGYALLQGNAPEKLLDRGAPVRSFGKLDHSLTWDDILTEEQNRTHPEGAVALPAVAQKPEDEQLEKEVLPIADAGGPAIGEPPLKEEAPPEHALGEKPLKEEAPPEHALGENPLKEEAPPAQAPGEEALKEGEAPEEVYHPPMVFLKHVKWDTSGEEEPGQQDEEKKARRKRAKPYLEVVVETPNVGSREAMDANTDPGHTSAVLEFTAKTPSNEYKRAHLHVGFHPRAGAGIGGMEEALLHRTDYPGEVQDDSGTLSSASVRRRFPINKDKVKDALSVMDKYNSGMPYNLIYNNCTTFVANVAKQAAIPGVEGAFQETDWHFGLKAKAKLTFLQMFGRTMSAVKNKPAEMEALLQKRDFNAYDKMRLSEAELQHYVESLNQERGGSMKFHGYSPSDVAENLLAMQDKDSALIVNNPGDVDKDKQDADYRFRRAAWMHMLGKLGNANMNGAAPDGGEKALGLPAPQDFQRDIKKAATKWNYFSAWRREIRRKKGWSNPYGPQEVTETVRQMPEYLQDALEQYQVVRTARLGVSDEEQRESEDKLLDTLQTVQQQAETAADALQNTNAPEAFVSYWDKLKTAGMTAEQFKTTETTAETDTEDEEDIWAEAEEDEKLEAIPLNREYELLARAPDDALEKAVQEKLAGSALAPILQGSIPGILRYTHEKMNGDWLKGIQGKGLWDMSDGLAVFRLLPSENKRKAYEGLLKSLRGSKGKEAMSTWKQKLEEFHSHQQDPDGNEAASNTNDTRSKTVEEAIEQHLRSGIIDTGTKTMLLGFALRKAAAANNKSVEEMYAQQRQVETGLQAEQKAEDLLTSMVPSHRAIEIKNAIRGALQDKPVGETLKEEEIGKEIASYKEAMQTGLLGLFPEGFAGGEDSAQVIAEKACERLQQKVQQADKNDVEKVVRKETLAKGLQQMSESDLNSVTDGWEKLQTRYGQTVALAKAEAEKTHDQVTVRFAMGGLQILGIVKNSPKKQKVSLMQAERERMEGFKLEMTNILENARELLKKYGLESEYGIAYGVIASALEKKKPLDQLLG